MDEFERRLILNRAAPDLLEALKVCQTRIFVLDGSENPEYKLAADAIAKTGGE